MNRFLFLSFFQLLITTCYAQQTVGCKSGDCANGEGVFIYEGGTKYEGSFKNSSANGKGKATYSDGRIFNGNWVNGNPDGQGVLTGPDGSTYTGPFSDGKMNGKFIANYTNGTTEELYFEYGNQVTDYSVYKTFDEQLSVMLEDAVNDFSSIAGDDLQYEDDYEFNYDAYTEQYRSRVIPEGANGAIITTDTAYNVWIDCDYGTYSSQSAAMEQYTKLNNLIAAAKIGCCTFNEPEAGKTETETYTSWPINDGSTAASLDVTIETVTSDDGTNTEYQVWLSIYE